MSSDNNIQMGKKLDLVAPAGGVTVGVPVMVGSMLVVPVSSAAVGEDFVGGLGMVYNLPKEPSAVIAAGDIAYWDNTNGEFNTTGAGRFPAGTCVEDASGTDATVKVKLSEQATVAV